MGLVHYPENRECPCLDEHAYRERAKGEERSPRPEALPAQLSASFHAPYHDEIKPSLRAGELAHLLLIKAIATIEPLPSQRVERA